jgi:Ca-activated chloride channel family protein
MTNNTDPRRRSPLAAFAIYLAVALCAALLFASGWAAADEAADVVTRPDEAGQGSLLLRSGDGRQAVPVLDTDVAIHVTGIVARARVRQTFRNPGDEWQEGIYVFPLPENAAVDHMKMRIGERHVEAEVKEKAAAKAVYEQARDNGQRAALVEQERPNIFTTSVANIPPHGEIVIEIEYQQSLRYDGANGGRFSLRFPMVVGPRYIPGDAVGAAGSGWSFGTDQVADAARITPPVEEPQDGKAPINPVHLKVTLDAGVPLATVASPYHAVTVTRPDADSAVIELAAGSVPANKDFELIWTPAPSHAPQAALFTEPGGDNTYGLLMLMPPTDDMTSVRLPREVIYVIDTSGSMEGASIYQARDALELAVSRLSPEDRFNIIEFNSTATPLFADARPASADNVAEARDFARGLKAQGGTEMASALDMALNGREDSRRVRQVIFLTDGSVGNEDALFDLIRQKLGDSRLFTVGIGSAPNSWFMTKAAQMGRGTFTYIGRIEEVKEKMNGLFAKLESPVVKGVRIDWPGEAESWPARVPDLYLGEPVQVSVALDKDAQGDVNISGLRGDASWSARMSLADAQPGRGLGVLWARQKIESLTDSLHDGVTEDDIKPQVVAIALEHHLASKYTSLVAVDKTPVRPADAPLAGGAMSTNLPEGWNYQAVFGELPKGATGSDWHLLLAALSLALAVAMRFGGRRQALA